MLSRVVSCDKSKQIFAVTTLKERKCKRSGSLLGKSMRGRGIHAGEDARAPNWGDKVSATLKVSRDVARQGACLSWQDRTYRARRASCLGFRRGGWCRPFQSRLRPRERFFVCRQDL